MTSLVAENPVWYLIAQSDLMSKFVLIMLLFLSITCWAIFFYKLIVWRARHKQLTSALTHLKNAHNLEDVLYTASKFSHTLPGYLLTQQLSFVKSLLVSDKGITKTALEERDWELLQGRTNQLLDSTLMQEESLLPMLSMSAAISPLLGLFGTVWGLVHAFIDISQHQSADIAVVAPGIAEALITTVAGLLVAIPALVMFHVLALKLRNLEQEIVTLTNRFTWIVHKVLTKHNEEV